MTSRPRLPLPFGQGLDRDTGTMVADPKSQDDLRNVHLTQGLAFVRKGSEETAEFLDPDDDEPMDYVLGGETLKVANVGVVVCFRESTGEVHVYRVTKAGISPTHVGVWFTLDASAVTPPRVFLAEVAGLLFMAHDEPSVTLRAPTVYYDPTSGDLTALTASWAHTTEINPAGNDNALRFWKLAPIDDVVTVAYVDAGAGQTLLVTVVGTAISVRLATDGGGVITTTAAQLAAAIEASEDASELVGVIVDTDDGGAGTGAGIVTAIAATPIVTDGIRFRGVEDHLGAYLAGWGYGTGTETRPDLVRMSLPGEPTVFRLQYYESIGQRGEPVYACHSTGLTLICLKPFEVWEHFGTDRSNFGKRQVEPYVGLRGTRLAVVVDKVCLFWSHLGPRATNGSDVVDLAIPLALFVSAPSDLPAEGAADDAFAVFLPNRDEVRFHFGQRFYAYSIVTKQWAYGEMPFAPSIGFLLPGGGSDSTPPGYVTDLEVTEDIETP